MDLPWFILVSASVGFIVLYVMISHASHLYVKSETWTREERQKNLKAPFTKKQKLLLKVTLVVGLIPVVQYALLVAGAGYGFYIFVIKYRDWMKSVIEIYKKL